jgi:hypothetical protein
VTGFNLRTGKGTSGTVLLAFVLAGMLLGVPSFSANADVYSPNGVLLSSAEWKQTSTDGKNVTVRDALTNSANPMIIAGVKGVNGYSLTVMSFWSDSVGGNELAIEVRQNGSVKANCEVTSAKVGTTYATDC